MRLPRKLKKQASCKIIFLILLVFMVSCGNKDQSVIIPVKPFIVIDKERTTVLNYRITIVDLRGQVFTFDIQSFNEENYNLGDTIN